jgi:hypothetical protein
VTSPIKTPGAGVGGAAGGAAEIFFFAPGIFFLTGASNLRERTILRLRFIFFFRRGTKRFLRGRDNRGRCFLFFRREDRRPLKNFLTAKISFLNNAMRINARG